MPAATCLIVAVGVSRYCSTALRPCLTSTALQSRMHCFIRAKPHTVTNDLCAPAWWPPPRRYGSTDEGSAMVVVAPVLRFKDVGINANVTIKDLNTPENLIAGERVCSKPMQHRCMLHAWCSSCPEPVQRRCMLHARCSRERKLTGMQRRWRSKRQAVGPPAAAAAHAPHLPSIKPRGSCLHPN